jgi:ribosome biogenesis GTPase
LVSCHVIYIGVDYGDCGKVMAVFEKTTGLVIRITGSDYYVSGEEGEIRCVLRGRFRLEKDSDAVLPVVGDRVGFRVEKSPDHHGPVGLIVTVHPRKSIFARKEPSGGKGYRVLGANLDCVFLVFSVKQPMLKLRLVDRMIVAAESGNMEPVICVNKMDLAADEGSVSGKVSTYEKMGYKVILCSALRKSGLEPMKGYMAGKTSIMVGPSGAGKSSIISVLCPGLELRTAGVSRKTGKGRHTTTHFELHPIEGGGYLGDSPGIREFGIHGVERSGLDEYFRDFTSVRTYCRFTSCSHSHEPGCAVKDAVEAGSISHERYESYLKILNTLPG